MNLPPEALQQRLHSARQRREAEHRVRQRRSLLPLQHMQVTDGESRWVNFSSNDYLGLANEPASPAATTPHSARGSGASALVTGYQPAHQALETALAVFLEREAALLFSSGYLANLAVASSLAGRGDTVVQDRLCHASLIDGARLSGATLKRYAHGDGEAARQRLEQCPPAPAMRLLVTDGVFSMDGDVAPLSALAKSATDHGAIFVVDDAHGLGVLGPGGQGSCAAAGLDQIQVPVLVGTLGKSVGCAGAFVAGSKALIEHLVNEARAYIYTTAMPPAQAVAALAGVQAMHRDEWRRNRLHGHIARFRQGAVQRGITMMPSETPIQPLVLGSARQAVALSEALRRDGFLVTAIRPPTVPEGSSRLRITLSAGHSKEQIDGLLDALARGLGDQ